MSRFLICLILIILSAALILIWQTIYLPLGGSGQVKTLVIEKGQGLDEIATSLKKAGLIKSKYLFEIYTLLKRENNKLQAGTYDLWANQNMPEVLEVLVKGQTAKVKLTIIEGWNLRDIGFFLENRGMFQAEELFELTGFPLVDYSKSNDLPKGGSEAAALLPPKPKDFSNDFEFLRDKPVNLGLEGYLFPDTYLINGEEGIEKIIRMMLANFEQKLTSELRDEIKKQKKSIFEIITMASLLEKEVSVLEDKQIVAGILWKRLEHNIPLQVDATITYITGKKTSKISREETEIDSIYNTYKHQGLPLGPICNPGIDSVKASVYPKDSPYWYYLSAPDGQTIFSRTLEEHNEAKARYLR